MDIPRIDLYPDIYFIVGPYYPDPGLLQCQGLLGMALFLQCFRYDVANALANSSCDIALHFV